MKFGLAGAAFLGIVLLGGAPSYASVLQLAFNAQLSASDTTLDFTGAAGSLLPDPVAFSGGGNTLTFMGQNANFELDQANYNYGGTAFPSGTNILYASGFQGSGAPVTIDFARPVTQFGFNTEEFNGGAFTVTFDAYDGQRLLGAYTDAGVSGSVLSFEGLQASGGDQITSLTVADNNGNDIGFGPITFGSPAAASVAEPGSVTLLAAGLLAAGLLSARRRRASAR